MPKNKPSEETLAQVRRVIDALNERGARKQAIRLKVTCPEAPLSQTASKFGGRPYLPAGELPPTNEKGELLGMIAQINCTDLPKTTFTRRPVCCSSGLTPTMKNACGVTTTRTRSRRRTTAWCTTRL